MEEQLYYKDALKLAQKDYRACISKGKSPCLPVLDDFVTTSNLAASVDLGIVQIPASLIVGTKTRGRMNAFSSNFMPILEEGTEFADKWKRLCDAHLTEGIRDPIKAYEYMNRYYVEEGNKRVSVLKFFDALTIPGHVIRILPEGGGEEVELYNEFLEFYKYSKVNFIEFSKKGCYAMLQKALGKEAGEEWSDDDRSEFAGTYYHFKKAYLASGGDKLQSTVGDAMLSYIIVYGYPELSTTETSEIKKNLVKMWEEVELHADDNPIELKTEPPEEIKQGVIAKMLTPKRMKVAFIHDGSPEKSGWVHDHEKGRNYVQRVFEDTRLTKASLRAAIDNPEIIVMNCALNKSHRYIRSYYTRMYEAKFVLGALAGSLSESGNLGYVCDYPIYGQIAGINAFALGAQMANPRAKVYLEWSAIDGAKEAARKLAEKRIHYISSQDTARFREDDRESFGLSYVRDDERELLANPVWKWGVYYEEILRRVFNKTMQAEYEKSNKALNYYWGMSAGVVDIGYSPSLNSASKIHTERRCYRKGRKNAQPRPDHQYGLPC